MRNQIKCTRCSKPLENSNVPLMVHESDMARSERANRRLWITVIILIIAILASNIAWIIYESQYQYVEIDEYSVEQDANGQGINNSIIGGGNINGEAKD